MKKWCRRLAAAGLAVTLSLVLPVGSGESVTAWAKGKEEETASESIPEPSLMAQAAVLMDGDSGRVLYGKNAEAVLPMASTTKIMTCILALEEASSDAVVEVSAYAASMPDETEMKLVRTAANFLGKQLES